MLAGEKDKKPVILKVSCQVCGLIFANENENQKHLEHVKKKKPVGVR